MRIQCIATGSHGNCYLLHSNNGHCLMLDCGKRVKWNDIMVGCDFNPNLIDAALITHWHGDHLCDVGRLLKQGISVYGSRELQIYVSESQNQQIDVIEEKTRTQISGGWRVIAWYVPHTDQKSGNVPCYAYLIESPEHEYLAYLTDFLYSPMGFRNIPVKTILVACNYDGMEFENDISEEKYKHLITGHSSLSVVNELVKHNQSENLKNVILCHLSQTNATPELMSETIKNTVGNKVNVFIAQKGKEYYL